MENHIKPADLEKFHKEERRFFLTEIDLRKVFSDKGYTVKPEPGKTNAFKAISGEQRISMNKSTKTDYWLWVDYRKPKEAVDRGGSLWTLLKPSAQTLKLLEAEKKNPTPSPVMTLWLKETAIIDRQQKLRRFGARYVSKEKLEKFYGPRQEAFKQCLKRESDVQLGIEETLSGKKTSRSIVELALEAGFKVERQTTDRTYLKKIMAKSEGEQTDKEIVISVPFEDSHVYHNLSTGKGGSVRHFIDNFLSPNTAKSPSDEMKSSVQGTNNLKDEMMTVASHFKINISGEQAQPYQEEKKYGQQLTIGK